MSDTEFASVVSSESPAISRQRRSHCCRHDRKEAWTKTRSWTAAMPISARQQQSGSLGIRVWETLMKVLFLPLDGPRRHLRLSTTVGEKRPGGSYRFVPPRALFGSLNSSAKVEAIISWIDAAIARERPSRAPCLCLDTLLYGGLIDSRRSSDSLKTILGQACHP